MKVRKAILLLFVLLSAIPVLAQVDTAWVRRYNGPANGVDNANALAIDKSGNVYVAGESDGEGTGRDFATIKYDSNGDTLWARRYNGPVDSYDFVTALAVNRGENVYVIGGSKGENYLDYATIKYSPRGDTLWVRRYNGSGNGNDVPTDLKVDRNGNVYVTGFSKGIGLINDDFATIKYAPNGDVLWIRLYNGSLDTTRSLDVAQALEVDNNGNVYVTGYSSNGAGLNWATIKYSPDGDTLWVRRYFGYMPWDLTLDDEGNLYVTGDSNIIKYFPNGDVAWAKRFVGSGKNIKIHENGNVYVAGFTGFDNPFPIHFDYITIRYNPNGDTSWVRTYDGPANDRDEAVALALDRAENVYVAGWSNGTVLEYDYATIKYAPTGDVQWVSRYNGPGNGSDYATALALDTNGNIYVTGRSSGNGTSSDYATIKYIQFDCTALSGDADADDTLLLSDVVYLINFLFKSQPAPNPLCRGDVNVDGKILLSDIVYLINYLYKSGPAPQKSRECCL